MITPWHDKTQREKREAAFDESCNRIGDMFLHLALSPVYFIIACSIVNAFITWVRG